MSESFNPARGGLSRVFLIEGGARPDHIPSYEGCMRAGSPEQSFGDIERQECPSPTAYDEWDVVSEVQGATEPPSISLSGHYAVDLTSKMLRLARAKCPFDLHVHFGLCSDPDDFTEFTKAMVFEIARFTNWSADELGALQSADNAGIMENADISGRLMYEVVPLNTTEEALTVVTNPLIDVIIPSQKECGLCDNEDDGCKTIMAVSLASPGSPGTAPDVVWTSDGGVNFYADDISTLDAAEDADAIAQIGRYVVVASNADGGLHYKLRTTLLAGTALNWTRVTTGIVAGGEPNDIWSLGTRAFVVGDGGYVYLCTNIPAGVTVLDAGDATTQNLNAVHAISRNFAVAVGESGAIIKTTNGSAFGTITDPSGGASLTCVWCFDENVWIVGTGAGAMWYTVDSGVNFTQLTNLPITFSGINDIAFHNRSIGYVVGNQTAGAAGVVLRTYDGGQQWRTVPEGFSTFPASDDIDAVAACKYDENFAAFVGLADDAADGIFVLGQE
jgi:photosystem II stability/assembly factor-like uncharacterized protein